MIGAGFLCGIGFTMSFFTTLPAFGDPAIVTNSKMAVLLTSILSGVTGFVILSRHDKTIHSL